MGEDLRRGVKEIRLDALKHTLRAAGLDTYALADSLNHGVTRADMLAIMVTLNTLQLRLRDTRLRAEEEVLDMLPDPNDVPF